MPARLTRGLPREGHLYEPKWDGLRCLAVREAGETAAERAPGRTAADRLAPERPAALGRVCARARASAPLRWDEVEALPERLEHSPAQVLARLREYGELFR